MSNIEKWLLPDGAVVDQYKGGVVYTVRIGELVVCTHGPENIFARKGTVFYKYRNGASTMYHVRFVGDCGADLMASLSDTECRPLYAQAGIG